MCTDRVPEDFLTIIRAFHKGADDLGFRAQYFWQLIEIGCQCEFHAAGNAAEAFSCDTEVLSERRANINQVSDSMCEVLKEFKDRKISCVLSWKTGAKEDRLSSKITLVEYALNGKAEWTDALPFAAIDNAEGEDEIFNSDNYTENDKKDGRQYVFGKLDETIKEGKLLILEKNEGVLFPNAELERIVTNNKYGFKLDARYENDEIMVYKRAKTDTHPSSCVLLIKPFCIAADSRTVIGMLLSIQRYLTVGVIKCVVHFITTGNHIHLVDSPKTPDIVTCSCVFELTRRSLHQNKKVAAAMAREVVTDKHTNALTQNALSKAQSKSVSSQSRRPKESQPRYDPEGRQNDTKIFEIQCNLLSFSTPSTIRQDLKKVNSAFNADKKACVSVSKRWETLRSPMYCVSDSVFYDHTKTYRVKTAKNRGNTDPYAEFNLKLNNDEVDNLVHTDTVFYVRRKKWRKGDEGDEHENPNQEGESYPVMHCMTHNGLRMRLREINISSGSSCSVERAVNASRHTDRGLFKELGQEKDAVWWRCYFGPKNKNKVRDQTKHDEQGH